jgi:hypothetical protein
MAKLRRGNAPTIRRGPYAGDLAEVDHIIPRAVAPEVDAKLFNLEFMPSRMNREKAARIGQRQVALARKLHAAGLFSDGGFSKIPPSKGCGEAGQTGFSQHLRRTPPLEEPDFGSI